MARSWFWLLGGPNGSGKSTFAATDVFARLTKTPEAPHDLVAINPDALARLLREERPGAGPDEIAREAATRSDAQVHALIAESKPLLVETVLSTAKFRPCVLEARAKDYRFGMIYVILKRPDLNIARVAQRVAQDGHAVDPVKIVDRYGRSLQQLKWFAPQADYFTMWDNSRAGGPPELLIEATSRKLHVAPACNALLDDPQAEPALKHAIHDLIGALEE